MRPYTLLLLLPLLFSNCEQPVDFEIGDGDAKLVVVSNFTNDNALGVFVSKTRSTLSNDPFEYVLNAKVQVFADGQLVETLQFVPADAEQNIPPYYTTVKLVPEVGKLYSIEVNVEGYEPIRATNSIPETVLIESVQFENTLEKTEDDLALVNCDVAVDFSDPVGNTNYYHLSFFQELVKYSLDQNGDTIFQQVMLNLPIEINPVDENAPITKYIDKRSFLFDDQSFNGEKMSLSFTGNYEFSQKNFIPRRFLVELRSVSEEYFLYRTTLTQQNNNRQDPLSEAVQLYHNIQNGCGIFAGYSANSRFFELNQ